MFNSKPWIVGHRGAPRIFHENTLKSFTKAVELGADAIEMDVRETADGVLVVVHDSCIITPKMIYPVHLHTFTQLQKACCQLGYELPTLFSVVKSLQADCKFLIELKVKNVEKKVLDITKQLILNKRVAFQSFSKEICHNLLMLTSAPVGLLLGSTKDTTFDEMEKFSFIALRKQVFLKQRKHFKQLYKKGLSIAVWTVDGTPLMHSLFTDPIVSAIITNKCDCALTIREKITNKNGENLSLSHFI